MDEGYAEVSPLGDLGRFCSERHLHCCFAWPCDFEPGKPQFLSLVGFRLRNPLPAGVLLNLYGVIDVLGEASVLTHNGRCLSGHRAEQKSNGENAEIHHSLTTGLRGPETQT